MIVRSALRILFCLAVLGAAGRIDAQVFDIATGGVPTITGAVGGSVSGSSSTAQDLNVIINFGEVSPMNTNRIVKVTVPVAIRSLTPYKVTATVTGSGNVNAQAVQRSDIGFGVNNMRRTGLLSALCFNSNHIFYNPFTTDPSTTNSVSPTGRVTYPGTLNNLGTSTVILSGPQLSFLLSDRFAFNAYMFDAIFTITPQYYAPGTTSVNVVLSISSGPNVPC